MNGTVYLHFNHKKDETRIKAFSGLFAVCGERANDILDFMIQEHKDYLKPHKEVLDKVLALIKED